MPNDYLEFSQGSGSDIAKGTYRVTLTDISEVRTNIAQRGPNAGNEFSIRDWTFFTDDDQEIRDSASVSSSTRSKQYQWVTALLGGTPPALDEKIDFAQLIGREASATVDLIDGWPKIVVLAAIPPERKAGKAAGSPAVAARTAAMTARAAAPAAEAEDEADLPF